MEKWDVYDIHKNKIIGKVVSSTKELNKDEYNLVTVAWICNSNGELLMQKRAANKAYPLVYANHGGRALSGESSIESMIRELKEEIGLSLSEEELTLVRTFNDHESLFDEYLVYKDVKLDELVLNKEEVDSCRWFSIEELSNQIENELCFDYKNNFENGEDSFSIIKSLVLKK